MKKSDCGPTDLAKIINCLHWHDHFRFERNLINWLVSNSVKQSANIVVVACFVTDT